MTTEPATSDAKSVRTWMASAGIRDDDPRLQVLAAFCSSIGATPDDLVDVCLRSVEEGQFKIRTAARRQLSDQIETFQAGDQARGNVVRSFLIHNGVSLQPPRILR